jgi:hypothetical protein
MVQNFPGVLQLACWIFATTEPSLPLQQLGRHFSHHRFAGQDGPVVKGTLKKFLRMVSNLGILLSRKSAPPRKVGRKVNREKDVENAFVLGQDYAN